MSWTVVEDDGRLHVRAIIDPLKDADELVDLIASLQKHTNKEPVYVGPPVSRITPGAQEAAAETTTRPA